MNEIFETVPEYIIQIRGIFQGLKCPFWETNAGHIALSYIDRTKWTKTPYTLKQTKNLYTFKHNLKEHFKARNFYFTHILSLLRKNTYSNAIYAIVWNENDFWGGQFFSILCSCCDSFLAFYTAAVVVACTYRPLLFKELIDL